MEVFENLDPLLRTFWFVAIPTSMIFLIQTIMSFMGGGDTDGLDADFDGDLTDTEAPFQFFTLRNLINFLLGFSWTGISFYNIISNSALLVTLSVVVGLAFVVIFFIIIKQVMKLAEDNTFRIEKTLNKTAEVYLTIPENRSGRGKIMISVNGTFHELEAMTENETLQSGMAVKVTRIENSRTLIVEKI